MLCTLFRGRSGCTGIVLRVEIVLLKACGRREADKSRTTSLDGFRVEAAISQEGGVGVQRLLFYFVELGSFGAQHPYGVDLTLGASYKNAMRPSVVVGTCGGLLSNS